MRPTFQSVDVFVRAPPRFHLAAGDESVANQTLERLVEVPDLEVAPLRSDRPL
jgi:hypothetical protein